MQRCVAGTGAADTHAPAHCCSPQPHAACILMRALQTLATTPCQAPLMKTAQICLLQRCRLTINWPALQTLQGTPGDSGQALHAPNPAPGAGCHVDTLRVLPSLTTCQLQLPCWRAGAWLHLAASLPCPSPPSGGRSGVWRLQVRSRRGARADAGGGG